MKLSELSLEQLLEKIDDAINYLYREDCRIPFLALLKYNNVYYAEGYIYDKDGEKLHPWKNNGSGKSYKEALIAWYKTNKEVFVEPRDTNPLSHLLSYELS